ncbi:MAG: hypothetical protein MZV65_28655 [Chromatiales bacterium]|nr:hypothetical protein [Chromatiales bacterium]
MKALGSAISEAKIAFSTPLLEPLTAQVQKLSEKVLTFTKSDAFTRMSQGMVWPFDAMVAAATEFLSKVDWETLGQRIAEFARGSKEALDAFIANVRARWNRRPDSRRRFSNGLVCLPAVCRADGLAPSPPPSPASCRQWPGWRKGIGGL